MHNKIDHFAIGAHSLEQGARFVQQHLGVQIPRGGKHEAMSTHNCVASAGNDSFLEILAIDPTAPKPPRTRWFTLDDPNTQARLKQRAGPLCWVVGTDDLDAIVKSSPVDLGEVVLFTRGERSWRLTVPEDGSLSEAGLLPAFIEWSPGPHPSAGMQDLGIRLEAVNLYHPKPDELKAMLKALSVDHLASIYESSRLEIGFSMKISDGTVVEIR